MTGYVEQLVEALRTELQHYGEMLALLDAREPANNPGLPALLSSCESIRRQGAAIDDARTRRLELTSRLAWAAGHPDQPSIPGLLPALPPDYQPLLDALHHEVESVVHEVRARACVGHAQLHHAVGDLERFIATLDAQARSRPGEATTTAATRSANA